MIRPVFAVLMGTALATRALGQTPDEGPDIPPEPAVETPHDSDAPGEPGIGLSLGASVGAGLVREAETGERPAFAVHAQASFGLPADLRLVASFHDRLQRQAYWSKNPEPGVEGQEEVVQDEQVIDTWLGVDWDLAPLAGLPDALHLRLGLAPRFFGLHSAAFPVATGAFRLSGAAEVSAARHVVFLGHLGWGMALFGTKDTLSVLGLPKTLWDAHVGAALDFGHGPTTWRLTGGWSLDSIVFEHSTRVGHLAMAGVVVTL